MHADRIAPIVSYIPLADAEGGHPGLWFVKPVRAEPLLKLLRIRRSSERARSSRRRSCARSCWRASISAGKHRALLANLLDLEAVT
jgi:hypothetical protein